MLLEPSKHRRRLNEVYMVVKVARETIARSSDQVIIALRVFPDVIGLRKWLDDYKTKHPNSETYSIEHLLC